MSKLTSLMNTFRFVIELDKLKSVYRKTKVIEEGRQENSAEHSWQICMLALTMEEFADFSVDMNRVIKLFSLVLPKLVVWNTIQKRLTVQNMMLSLPRIFSAKS